MIENVIIILNVSLLIGISAKSNALRAQVLILAKIVCHLTCPIGRRAARPAPAISCFLVVVVLSDFFWSPGFVVLLPCAMREGGAA
ncbi:hypothetical protein ACFFU8_15395 [Chromobacterium piscinae]|uniref:hypothetical protein n=1 Tax=Chromobacterium piscinae TaxID=686831 RepID=UPI001E3A925A|nr:hypothetical protein [Chromobacterium piscinae]MCD5330301.1 hypothetical protein [Chromobacterium piscinae]